MKKTLLLLVSITVLHLLVRLSPDEFAWDVYSIVKQIESSLLVLYSISLISYRQLAIKSILAAWFITEVVDIFNYLFWLAFDNKIAYLYIIKAILSMSWLLYIWFRNYDRVNDLLDEEHFFLVSIRPNSLQDFILSLIKEPVAGGGIYAKGVFFHYRKGELQTHDRKYIERLGNKYRIRRIRRIDPDRLLILDSLLGSKYGKWSLLYNCKTVLEPILSSRGKPIV